MAEKRRNDITDVVSKAKTSMMGKIPAKRSSETNVPEPNRLKADAVRPQKSSKCRLSSYSAWILLETVTVTAKITRFMNITRTSRVIPRLNEQSLMQAREVKVPIRLTNQIGHVLQDFLTCLKKFKVTEVTDKSVDEVLSDTMNDLFRKGMDGDMYDNLVKGDSFARPEN